jgi:hypothetical protein
MSLSTKQSIWETYKLAALMKLSALASVNTQESPAIPLNVALPVVR